MAEREEDRPTDEVTPPKPVAYTIEEMGEVDAGGRSVRLSADFLRNHLGANWFDDILVEHGVGSQSTPCLCPFCQEGHLQLVTIDPQYRSGSRDKVPQNQTGNRYLYECSNTNCEASFWGIYYWEEKPREEQGQ